MPPLPGPRVVSWCTRQPVKTSTDPVVDAHRDRDLEHAPGRAQHPVDVGIELGQLGGLVQALEHRLPGTCDSLRLLRRPTPLGGWRSSGYSRNDSESTLLPSVAFRGAGRRRLGVRLSGRGTGGGVGTPPAPLAGVTSPLVASSPGGLETAEADPGSAAAGG